MIPLGINVCIHRIFSPANPLKSLMVAILSDLNILHQKAEHSQRKCFKISGSFSWVVRQTSLCGYSVEYALKEVSYIILVILLALRLLHLKLASSMNSSPIWNLTC